MTRKFIKDYLVKNNSECIVPIFEELKSFLEDSDKKLKRFKIHIKGKQIPEKEFEGRKWDLMIEAEVDGYYKE